MDPTLKQTEYDVILVGTGMVEAILAGYVLSSCVLLHDC